jgi:hypothetical protein
VTALAVGPTLVLGVFSLLTVVVWVPAIMFTFGLWWIDADLFDDPARAEPASGDSSYEARFRQFEALGFRAAGMTRKTGWFISPLSWISRSGSGTRWMRSADGLMFVTFRGTLGGESERISITTLTDGGGLVRTSRARGPTQVKPTAKYGCYVVEGAEPPELVAQQRENVASFCRERGLGSKQATFREAAAAELALDRLATKGRPRGGVAEGYRELQTPRWTTWPAFVLMGLSVWMPVPRQLLKFLAAAIVVGVLIATFVVRPLARRR